MMSAQAIPRVLDINKETVSNSAYILPADQAEANRLELQHNFLKEALDGKLLLCPFEGQGAYSILDSGVGRASWICDIASRISPSSDLQGIDIKDNNFPHELPSNVSLSVNSVLSLPSNVSLSVNSVLSLPEEWGSRFDIVHQRLLMAALRSTEWPIALSNIYRVLRPGGWVQLSEYGTWREGPCIEKYMLMQREVYGLRGLNRDIFEELPTLLKAAGFADIHEEKRILPVGKWAGKLGEDVRDMCFAYTMALKDLVLNSEEVGFAQTEEEFDRSIDALRKECDETEGTGLEYYIFYAQRPST